MWGLDRPLVASHNHHGPVLIIGFSDAGSALFVCDDGQLRFEGLSGLKAEWRFNWTTHAWEDTELGDFDDQGSDGGPEVSGDISEPDRANRSDPSDEGDGAAGSVDPE